MLMTLEAALPDRRDLGYLMHKHPDRLQTFDAGSGEAVVFYPNALPDACSITMALLSKRNGTEPAEISKRIEGAFVDPADYASASRFAVALGRVFGTAMGGRCPSRQELADGAHDLTITLSPVPIRARLGAAPYFEPLGWTVEAHMLPLDPAFPAWGDSRYATMTLKGRFRISEALRHLYVLLPVLEGSRHHFLAEDEVAKLMRHGEEWLPTHPLADTIASRYLGRRHKLVKAARAEIANSRAEKADDHDGQDPTVPELDSEGGRKIEPRLQELRIAKVSEIIAGSGVRSVLDLGCGQGDLIAAVLKIPAVERIIGLDASLSALEAARREFDAVPQSRLSLAQGDATWADGRFEECEAIVLGEVIEHLDPWMLDRLEETIFGRADGPRMIVVTTPNREWNVNITGNLPTNGLRHPDHRFEFTRAEFEAWVRKTVNRFTGQWEIFGVGTDTPQGFPTLGCVFTRHR
jgi:3' terminal RNA ribose 2'-O-methyltransferase Hen1